MYSGLDVNDHIQAGKDLSDLDALDKYARRTTNCNSAPEYDARRSEHLHTHENISHGVTIKSFSANSDLLTPNLSFNNVSADDEQLLECLDELVLSNGRTNSNKVERGLF